MLLGSPVKNEQLGMQDISAASVIACRRRIKQLEKALEQEKKLLGYYQKQFDFALTCELEDDHDYTIEHSQVE